MEIEIFFKDYCEALKLHKESLLRQISRAKELNTLAIIEQQEYLQEQQHESKYASQFAENLLRNGNDFEILTLVGVLKNHFDVCQKVNIQAKSNLRNFEFLRKVQASTTSQQYNIPIYGILAAHDIDSN